MTMNPNVFVYISGPMTAKHGYSIEDNVAAGAKVYFDLLARGIPAFSPHLSGLYPTAWSVLDHAGWLAYDKAVIDRCTHLLMMERWETSTGAVIEYEYAQAIGKPIFYNFTGLVNDCNLRLPANV